MKILFVNTTDNPTTQSIYDYLAILNIKIIPINLLTCEHTVLSLCDGVIDDSGDERIKNICQNIQKPLINIICTLNSILVKLNNIKYIYDYSAIKKYKKPITHNIIRGIITNDYIEDYVKILDNLLNNKYNARFTTNTNIKHPLIIGNIYPLYYYQFLKLGDIIISSPSQLLYDLAISEYKCFTPVTLSSAFPKFNLNKIDNYHTKIKIGKYKTIAEDIINCLYHQK